MLTRCDFMWDYEPASTAGGRASGRAPIRARRPTPPPSGKCLSAIEDSPGSVHPSIAGRAIRRPILWHTRPGEHLYEPFAGSGTALIAAQASGRICHAIELSPVFVDVAVARWERFTAQRAQRIEGGGR